MARSRKSWQQKLADAKAKPDLPKKWYCDEARCTMVVPSPGEVEAIIRDVKRGRLITMKQVAEALEKKHGADRACPMTTGIFASLVAHAAYEQEQEGRRRTAPWWRVLKQGGELNPKYPESGKVQRAKLEAEGHRVERKGKRLVVAEYEKRLVGAPRTAAASRNAGAGGGFSRKVLQREDFGLCVLLPKTEWARLPDSGSATVSVDGERRRVVVQSEACNCRGTGWHEHRFLSLPATVGVRPGQRVAIAL